MGGRFNRVGTSRKTIEGEIYKLQFFIEWSKDALQFDTDSELYGHMSREVVRAMNRIVEDLIQMDVIHGAGVHAFTGTATSRATMGAEGAELADSVVQHKDLQKLSIVLDKLRCPRKTTILTGSRMQDTKVIQSARYMIVGPDILPTLQNMIDQFGNPAFVDVAHYAYSGAGKGLSAQNEIGACAGFRFIQYMDMMYWAGEGAEATVNPRGYAAEVPYTKIGQTPDLNAKPRYNVYPMVMVGEGSFSNVGFATDGKNTKFKIKHSFPEDDISYSSHNPYGSLGFMSCQFYHGLLVMRPERIAVLHTLAKIY